MAHKSSDHLLDISSVWSISDLMTLSQPASRMQVSAAVYNRLAIRRQRIEEHLAQAEPLYGVTTGVGALKTYTIPQADLVGFNHRMVRDHAAGFGDPIDPTLSRLVMAIRLIELAQGGSGISPDTFTYLLECFNEGLVPVMPSQGSVGEADITILAHLGQMVMGQGRVWQKGRMVLASQALAQKNREPLTLKARDGLALMGGNSYSLALTVKALHEWRAVHGLATMGVAMSWAAWRANPHALRHDVLAEAGPQVADEANALIQWLQGTSINARAIQDPLSWRCVPQVHGAMREMARRLDVATLHDIYASRDNPLVLDAGDVVSNGNFDVTFLALNIDSLRSALVRVMALLAQRVAKLLNHHYSDLPSGLAPIHGDAGLGLLEFDVSAIMAEAEMLSRGPILQSGVVAEGVEDYGSMAPASAIRLQQMVGYWRRAVAIELTCAMQAIDLQRLTVGGPLTGIVTALDRVQKDLATPYERVNGVEAWLLTESPKIYDNIGIN